MLFRSIPPYNAATGSCLEEAGGPDSLYIDPKDADGLAAAINSILNNPQLFNQMKEKGLSYVQKFNTVTLAHQLMNCYQNIASAD